MVDPCVLGSSGRARYRGAHLLAVPSGRFARTGAGVASLEVPVSSQVECEAALRGVLARLHAVDPAVRGKYAVTRSISLRVPDLHGVFHAQLQGDAVADLRWVEGADTDGAQVRLCADSDDLIAVSDGTLAPAVAWATGRLKVEASMLDLLKLRSLL